MGIANHHVVWSDEFVCSKEFVPRPVSICCTCAGGTVHGYHSCGS